MLFDLEEPFQILALLTHELALLWRVLRLLLLLLRRRERPRQRVVSRIFHRVACHLVDLIHSLLLRHYDRQLWPLLSLSHIARYYILGLVIACQSVVRCAFRVTPLTPSLLKRDLLAYLRWLQACQILLNLHITSTCHSHFFFQLACLLRLHCLKQKHILSCLEKWLCFLMRLVHSPHQLLSTRWFLQLKPHQPCYLLPFIRCSFLL